MLPTSAGVEPTTAWSPVGCASNWAKVFGQTGLSKQYRHRWDSAEHGIWTGSTLSVTQPAVFRHINLVKSCLNLGYFFYYRGLVKDTYLMIILGYFFYGNIYCGYSLEVPRWGTSNEYPQYMFLWKTGEIIPKLSPNTSPKQVLWDKDGKLSVYLGYLHYYISVFLTWYGTVKFIFAEYQGIMGYCTSVELASPHNFTLSRLILFVVTFY